MGTVLPNLIVGPIALCLGILVFIFRARIRDWTVDSQGAMFGHKTAETAGRLQTPIWVGVAGIFIAAIGVLMIVGGIAVLLAAK
ncbi:hypothetical protein [Leifsonia sp. NPDC058230]|uniref:hypothetical protein n=1 Tax=Leifsonia sp. NPDC058230 TaxID=3346391 RepID=UPI0036DE44D2